MNFKIESKEIISTAFRNKNIFYFEDACEYVTHLDYKRNLNKDSITCIFEDQGGTCSTKHATLRKLALENNHPNVKLILGIFKMDANYSSLIKDTLLRHNLECIPEAHNYLKIDGKYVDFTKPGARDEHFRNKILIEKEIEYNQINQDKITFHKNFLNNWIQTQKTPFTLEELWAIREQCIADLQNNS